jgi:hypothetical protein
MVEPGIVDDAERAQVDEPADSGSLGRIDHVASAFDVDPVELPTGAPIAGQGNEMDDAVGAGERGAQAGGIVDIAGAQVNAIARGHGETREDLAAGRTRTDQGEHLVASADQLGNHMTADEPLAPVTRTVDMA